MTSTPDESPVGLEEAPRFRVGPFTDQPVLDELANAFFREFSRMEYALKASGYLLHQNGNAEPHWDRFARAIETDLGAVITQDADVREAVRYISETPPKKQVAVDGHLVWRDTRQKGNATVALFLYIRRVRNNLFHGGKFSGRWFDAKRSELLIRSSLLVLDACLAASPELREVYEA